MAAVVVLALGVTAVVATFATGARPQTSGTITVAGMGDAVTVRRDASGVPHLSGRSLTDLAGAQGFVHAQDRFFDMDLRRHIATGTLSELVGEQGLPADRVVRTMGWRQVAEQSLPLLEPETRRLLTAYADGVNAYVKSRSKNRLALEYPILGVTTSGYTIRDWTPVDSLAWLTAMAWDLRGNYSDELARARLVGRVDRQQILQLYPAYDPALHAPILGPGEWPAAGPAVPPAQSAVLSASVADPSGSGLPEGPAPLGDRTAQWYAAVDVALSAIPSTYGRGEGVGSNSWVISGEHTATGQPLLANDPHLGTRLPGIWYQNSLTCVEVSTECPMRVSGFSFPGLPGVVIGHNEHIAWGLTNLGPDVSDFYLERLDGTGQVLRDGAWQPVTSRTERIDVAGGGSEQLTVRSTVHGPLVSDVVAAAADGGAHADTFGLGDEGQVHALALAWTGLQPSRTADAIIGLNRARNFGEFRQALTNFAVPSQNVIYADREGHIGYQAPGVVPIRASITPDAPPGFWPTPGWDSRYDWQGTVPFDQLPWALDPPDGVIVAANQEVTQAPGPFLTSEWDHGYRAERIRTLLATVPDGGFTADDMRRIALDTQDPFAPTLVKALLDIDLRDDPFTREAQELLRDWDHTTPASGKQAAAAAYFNVVWANLLDLTFADELPEDLAANGGSRHRAVVTALLAEPTNPWWDDKDTVGVTEGRNEVLRKALVNARLELTRSSAKDPAQWSWGDLHRWAPKHSVMGGDGVPGVVRWMFNEGDEPLGGGSSIVNANGYDASKGYAVSWAPSMRMVVDLANLDRSLWINQTGASGHPFSEHYTDQLADWAAGRMRPWAFTDAAVAKATKDTLVLVPAE